MNPKLQRRVQRYGWDKAASFYEQYWSAQLRPAQDKLLEMADLKPGEDVLDVACGTGLVTFRAARKLLPGGTILGTDISEEMVNSARHLAAVQAISNASFERMDAEDEKPFDRQFDAALCSLGLMYFPDPVNSLGQMKNALKAGGRAAAAVWGQRDRCGWAEIFPIVDSRVKSEVCPLFFRLGTQDLLARNLTEAGFESVRLERISTTLHYMSAEDACGAAFEGGPVALAYSRFDEKTKTEARAEYLESIEGFRIDERYEIPGEFVIAVGFKSAQLS